MNPNLTPVERAARNLFAANTGVTDDAIIELAFLDPTIARSALAFASSVMGGPYGTFSDDVCSADDAYLAALDDVLQLEVGILVCDDPAVRRGIELGEQALKLAVQGLRDGAANPDVLVGTPLEPASR